MQFNAAITDDLLAGITVRQRAMLKLQLGCLEAPLADLFDGKMRAGYHYDNPPSWEAADGSKVVKSGDAKSAPAPNPKEDILWLLVRVKAAEGKAGTFSPAVYIQRLKTVGGIAPAELPKRVGTKVGVAYKAEYYFYGKAE